MRPNAEEREALKDSDFGIPEIRKFVLVDKGNVRDAMIHFKYCPRKYKKLLADRIYDKAKKFGIKVSGEGEWFKHVSKERKHEVVKEDTKALDDYIETDTPDSRPDDDYNTCELIAGIKVEHEHTKLLSRAKIIAKDHLDEIPDYYTRLIEMEKNAGVEDED